MMTQEERTGSEPQAELLASPRNQVISPWYKNAGIGLVGGVVGALAFTLISPLMQAEREDSVTVLVNRLDEAKTDREREFSRVFSALAALEDKNSENGTTFDGVRETLAQLRTDMDGVRADLDKGGSRLFDALLELDEKSREHGETIVRLDENFTHVGAIQEEQARQLQDVVGGSASLAQDLDGLKSRLARLETQATTRPSPTGQEQDAWIGEVSALRDEFAALERQMAALPQLMQRLDDAERTALNIVDAQNSSIEGFMTEMRREFEAQQRSFEFAQLEIDALGQSLASLASAPPPASDQELAVLIAANGLKAAIDRGGSYVQELQIFAPLAPADLALDGLERYASTGLPNIAALSARFAKIADEIAATENVLAENAGLTDQILHQGNRLYSSRPVGNVDGTGAGAIAARMEVAIAQGDFARAVSEAQALPEEAKALAADFIEVLETRENIDALLSRLIANILAERK